MSIFKNKTFQQIYLSMYCQNRQKVKYNKDFYSTIIQFKQNGIIEQNIFDIPDSMILEILNDIKFQNQISNIFKHHINKSRHYYNISLQKLQNIKIYLYYFDFSKKTYIDLFHKSLFDVQPNIIDNLYYQFINKNTPDITGFIQHDENFDKDIYIIVLNQKHINLFNTLYHQLSHLLQLISKIKIVDNKYIPSASQQFLKQFNISMKQIQYYFSNTEFLPHIQDLIFGLKKVYQSYHTQISKYDFIFNLIYKFNVDNSINEDLFKQYQQKNKNIAPFVLFLFSKKFNYKFQIIKHYLFKQFN